MFKSKCSEQNIPVYTCEIVLAELLERMLFVRSLDLARRGFLLRLGRLHLGIAKNVETVLFIDAI